ncbi:NADH-quinone oxidoreductase subunit A [Candidatus Bathyarchaeota archaeon]|nr:NADH-quinone oxidoreductase subunit A [Candidatus Bathyarchaeota archaeon]MCK4474456.1 NADH-quinone oxidoreductase subunit A [Candidatus Bathyarchaeota archaeon]
MCSELLISLPVVFFLSLVIGLILYLVGWIVGAKGEKTVGKVAPYACGEDLPPRKFQVDVKRFFIYAVYFLIFDILAFILATSLSTPGFFPAIYAFIVLMAVVILLPLRRRE